MLLCDATTAIVMYGVVSTYSIPEVTVKCIQDFLENLSVLHYIDDADVRC